MIIYIGIIVIIVIVLLWKIFKKENLVTDNISNFKVIYPFYNNNYLIPKIIWSYWHDLSNVPHIVTKCIDTWIIHNPEYIINILDDNSFEKLTGVNIKQVFSITTDKTHQKKSDFIRLTLVTLYGGIWLDASMICMDSLEWIQSIQTKNNYEFIGYIAPSTMYDPVIDSWFLAAVPMSIFMKDWLNEFRRSLTYKNPKKYCKELTDKYPVPKELTDMLPYLTIHLCNWIIRFNNPRKYNIYLTSSTECGAPLYYMEKNGFYSYKVCDDLIKNKVVDMKLFKIIGPLRNILINERCKYNTTNKYINYVFDNKY